MVILPYKKQIIKELLGPSDGPWEKKIKHIPNWEMYFPLNVIEEDITSIVISRSWRFDSRNELICEVKTRRDSLPRNVPGTHINECYRWE